MGLRVLKWEISVRFWLKMVLAVLFVMLMPFWSLANSSGFGESTPILYFSYTCILFNYQNATDWQEPDFWFRDTPTVVAAFIVCIPAIYFNRRLSRAQKGKSIWDIGAATVFSTASLAAYFAYSFPPAEIAGFLPSLDSDLLNFASVVLLLLVLLPVFAREASRLGVERSIAQSGEPKLRGNTDVPRMSASTVYSIIGYVLGFAICLLPFILIINIWQEDNFMYDTISVMASINHRNYEGAIGWNFSEIRLEIPSLIQLVDVLVFTGFRTLFGYNVIRHCRGTTSRRRVLAYGIVGVLIPLFYFQIMQSQYSLADVTYLIPLPVVFILGYLVIRIVKPLEPRIETEARPPEEVIVVEELRRDSYEDVVKVPVLYSIRSRIGGAISRLKESRVFSSSSNYDSVQVDDESEKREVGDSE
jgi:hypothetical protein